MGTRDLISDDMSLFEEYASDFGDITLDISRNVYKIPSLSGGDKRNAIADAQSQLDEAESVIQQMTFELESLPRSEDARSALMGDYDEEIAQRSLDQRGRLLDSTARLHRDSERIQDIQRIALETEDTGGEILSTLGENREQIKRMHSNLHVADANIGRGGRFVRTMARRTI